jgi:membrane dipeptidase
MTMVFDGHNDVLLRMWMANDRDGRAFLDGLGHGHLDLPRARAGEVMGGFFAVFVPSQRRADLLRQDALGATPPDEMFGPIDHPYAAGAALQMSAILHRLTQARPDAIRVTRTVAEIEAARAAGAMAAILHFEGAEPIDPDLDNLDAFYAMGLRSLGPVWSRPNAFAHGVPFRFPGSPNEGGGLTDAGKALIKACNRLGIMLDLSHLNEAGFWVVAKLSDQPLVATHSNVHALAPTSRNLTDKQLDAIAESGGVVGLNYAVAFLREDGALNVDTPLTVLLRHLDYLITKLGEKGVALGSDYDGALIPATIGDAAGTQALVVAMRQAGYGDALVDRICHRNWLDLLRRVWGS